MIKARIGIYSVTFLAVLAVQAGHEVNGGGWRRFLGSAAFAGGTSLISGAAPWIAGLGYGVAVAAVPEVLGKAPFGLGMACLAGSGLAVEYASRRVWDAVTTDQKWSKSRSEVWLHTLCRTASFASSAAIPFALLAAGRWATASR